MSLPTLMTEIAPEDPLDSFIGSIDGLAVDAELKDDGCVCLYGGHENYMLGVVSPGKDVPYEGVSWVGSSSKTFRGESFRYTCELVVQRWWEYRQTQIYKTWLECLETKSTGEISLQEEFESRMSGAVQDVASDVKRAIDKIIPPKTTAQRKKERGERAQKAQEIRRLRGRPAALPVSTPPPVGTRARDLMTDLERKRGIVTQEQAVAATGYTMSDMRRMAREPMWNLRESLAKLTGWHPGWYWPNLYPDGVPTWGKKAPAKAPRVQAKPAYRALLAPPKRVTAHPAIIEHVGEAARFTGVTSQDLPTVMDVEPPAYMLIGFDWLSNHTLRDTLARAIAGETRKAIKDITAFLEAREIPAHLIEATAMCLRQARVWGAIPEDWSKRRVERPITSRVSWTPEDDDTLRELYGTHFIAEISKKMGRSIKSIETRASRYLKLSRRGASKLQMRFRSTADLAIALGTTYHAIHWWCRDLGLPYAETIIRADQKSNERKILLKDVESLLTRHPELIDWDRVDLPTLAKMGIRLERPTHAWKQVKCDMAEKHATGTPITFWTPFFEFQLICPCCGTKCHRLAVGEPRYMDTDPGPITPHYAVTPIGLEHLRAIEKAGGRESVINIARNVRGENRKDALLAEQLFRRLMFFELVEKESLPKRNAKRGDHLTFYSLTERGRQALKSLKGVA